MPLRRYVLRESIQRFYAAGSSDLYMKLCQICQTYRHSVDFLCFLCLPKATESPCTSCHFSSCTMLSTESETGSSCDPRGHLEPDWSGSCAEARRPSLLSWILLLLLLLLILLLMLLLTGLVTVMHNKTHFSVEPKADCPGMIQIYCLI